MNKTICAISTPPGKGGIAVIRISGPDTFRIVSEIWEGKNICDMASHTAHLGTILDCRKQPLDQAVLTIFRNPASFTGEDIIELSVHGSVYVQQELLNSLITAGASIAEPGEFTRRAFLNKKLDLTQVDGIASLIEATGRAAHQIAMNQMRGGMSSKLKELRNKLLTLSSLLELELDFSEEEVEFADRSQLIQTSKEILEEIETLRDTFRNGKAIKEGVIVAIAGATNAGKSSLLNILLKENKAIVSDIHGTTRDVIEDTTEIDGIKFRFLDTAGIRTTSDTIEQLGIERSIQAIEKAQTTIIVVDSTSENSEDQIENLIAKAQQSTVNSQIILINNKTDLPPHPESINLVSSIAKKHNITVINLSTVTQSGLQKLQQTLSRHYLPEQNNANTLMITNARHYQALANSAESTMRIINGLQSSLPSDLIAQDLRETLNHLGEITGEITSSEILQNIFQHFCIGK